MLKSLRIGARGLLAQVAKNDIIANNLANAATSGFKREIARFSTSGTGVPANGPSPAAVGARAGGGADAGSVSPGAPVGPQVSSVTDLTAGPVAHTGNPLDLAIDGNGFFVVEDGGAERYTRAGTFQLNDQGELVTGSGAVLQGTSGPLTVDPTRGKPQFATDGTLSVGSNIVGRVRVVRFDKPSALERKGDNLFAAKGESPTELDAQDVRVLPGVVEGSNVNAVREMINMISALRTYQASQKSIQASDQILDTMINRVGRAPASQG